MIVKLVCRKLFDKAVILTDAERNILSASNVLIKCFLDLSNSFKKY